MCVAPADPTVSVAYDPGPAPGSAPTSGNGAATGSEGSTERACNAAAVSMSTIARCSLALEIFRTPTGPAGPVIRNPWSRSLPSGVASPCSPKSEAARSAPAAGVNAGGSPRNTSPITCSLTERMLIRSA